MQSYTNNLLFELSDSIQDEYFFATELGKLYQTIPLEALAKQITPPKQKQSGQGCKPWFDVQGGIGLQILKSYFNGISDDKLIEQLNGNWEMQRFCNMRLRGVERIKGGDVVGWWRKYLSQHLNIDEWQQCLATHWQPHLQQTERVLMDATVFEEYITFPTDAKLLWNSCDQVYEMIQQGRKRSGLRKSRINHSKYKNKWLSYSKLRKKAKSKHKKICISLIGYLTRLLKALDQLTTTKSIVLKTKEFERLRTIRQVRQQQYGLYIEKTGYPKDRIVSLHKPYVRPVVRGKDKNSVEFGPKVNMFQVDGINFIDHCSFDNFNECNRLKNTVSTAKKYFGNCTEVAADLIYATNENRTFCKEENIMTNFKPKGRQGTGKDNMLKHSLRVELNKQRAVEMEGSFGNEKNHYQLSKIKSRSRQNDLGWIFFGLLTCNAQQMVKKMQSKEQVQKQAA